MGLTPSQLIQKKGKDKGRWITENEFLGLEKRRLSVHIQKGEPDFA